MLVSQIATAFNDDIIPNVLGGELVVAEDLSNIVEIGQAIGNANAYDKYINRVINHIGLVKVMDRVIKGNAPRIYKESWKYGSIMELLTFELPDAIDNDAYKLVNGQSYDQDIFYAPDVVATFFNNKVSWTIPMSFPAKGTDDDRITQSFSSAAQTIAFWNGIDLAIENALELQTDALISRTLNNYAAYIAYETILKNSGALTDEGSVQFVNVLKLYNDNVNTGTDITVSEAWTDPGFLKFASYTMARTMDHLTKASKMYNIAGKVRQTPRDALHFVTLSDFERATEMYLESDTFHKDLVELPLHEVTAFWQSPGEMFDHDSVSNIHVTIKGADGNTHEVNITGVIAMMFDDYAASVTNFKQGVTTHYNAKGDFINNFYSVTAGYNNMFDQNFVVFYIA